MSHVAAAELSQHRGFVPPNSACEAVAIIWPLSPEFVEHGNCWWGTKKLSLTGIGIRSTSLTLSFKQNTTPLSCSWVGLARSTFDVEASKRVPLSSLILLTVIHLLLAGVELSPVWFARKWRVEK